MKAPPKRLMPITVFLGGEPKSNNVYFKGLMDDVRIYERSLSPEEIQSLAK